MGKFPLPVPTENPQGVAARNEQGMGPPAYEKEPHTAQKIRSVLNLHATWEATTSTPQGATLC